MNLNREEMILLSEEALKAVVGGSSGNGDDFDPRRPQHAWCGSEARDNRYEVSPYRYRNT